MGIRKCHQHTAPKLGSGAARQRTSIAWLESVPATPGGFRPRWGTLLSPASWDTCEITLHVQMSPPTAVGPAPWLGSAAGAADIPADSGAERCHPHQPERGWRGEPPGWWESGIGVAGPGTNHVGAGGVCTPAGSRGPKGILRFAPQEMQISPSPGQGPRRVETELRQHPRNARPPAAIPTSVPRDVSRWG